MNEATLQSEYGIQAGHVGLVVGVAVMLLFFS